MVEHVRRRQSRRGDEKLSLAWGVLTVALLQFRRWPLPAPLARQTWIQRVHEQTEGVPYGIALAAAALVIYPQSGWMTA